MIEFDVVREMKPMVDIPVGMGVGIEIGSIFDKVAPGIFPKQTNF